MSFDDSSEIERLRQELEEMTAERDYLLAENHRLARAFQGSRSPIQKLTNELVIDAAQVTTTAKPSPSTSLISNESPLTEKIRLYRSLFLGREDVYARLYQSKNAIKPGYSPACKNEWVNGLCQKFKIKCSNCSNREFLPLTDQVIQNHLEGKSTTGIYPLLKNDSCYFLAIDFDKQSWMEDSAAFCETCYGLNIPIALERSRSGNGAHVWIFFNGAVSALVARNLGSYLVTKTMSRHHQLGMDSYDRLFPNKGWFHQDHRLAIRTPNLCPFTQKVLYCHTSMDSMSGGSQLGFVYCKTERRKKAISEFRIAVSKEPCNGEYLRGLGWAVYSGGEKIKGLAHLQKAHELKPCNINVLNDLCVAYLAMLDLKKAKKYNQLAVKIDRSNIIARNIADAILQLEKHWPIGTE
jgi:tetratricopeptide (TPR) repeat protein